MNWGDTDFLEPPHQQHLLGLRHSGQNRLANAGSVGDRRAADVVYIDFCKAFDIFSHKFPTDKLMKYRLQKWTVRWTEIWLNC